jgi:peptide/nickel transport system permease protein
MIPTLLGVAVLVFLVLRVIPGDIVQVKLSAEGNIFTEEQIHRASATITSLSSASFARMAVCLADVSR